MISVNTMSAPYVFVIDTADYAGNFERQICAYATGCVGQCGVGHEMADVFLEETGLEPFENVCEEMDDHGCSRPASIWTSPNGDMNSVAIFFAERPDKAQVAMMMERAHRFAALPQEDYGQRPLGKRVSKILGFRLLRIEKEISITEEKIA